MKDSKAMVKKEISFMKKKGAPKSMIKHEMAEAEGMCYGGKVKKMAAGGMTSMKKVAAAAVKGHEKRMHKMAGGGVTRADGCVMKGHTKGKMVKMAGGGGAMPKSNRDITKNYKSGGKVSSASSRADGCAIKGKTKGRMV